jgi:chromate transporter
VLHAAHRIGTRALKNRWMWGIAAASFVAIFAFDTPFPAIVLAAALIGWLRRAPLARRCSRWAAATARRGQLRAGADRRRHAHARACALQPQPAGVVLAVGLGCGRWPMALLVAAGWHGTR